MNNIEIICKEKNIRMTNQRKIIAKVVSESSGHPNVEELYQCANIIDSKISLATVYRTLKLFEQCNIIKKLEIGEGKARYEEVDLCQEHYHLIDVDNGDIIEFYDNSLKKLTNKIARRLGYQLESYNIELYGRSLKIKS
jgi:Fur family ferric uptake transcriptional regulator